jgi:hypothetical protein
MPPLIGKGKKPERLFNRPFVSLCRFHPVSSPRAICQQTSRATSGKRFGFLFRCPSFPVSSLEMLPRKRASCLSGECIISPFFCQPASRHCPFWSTTIISFLPAKRPALPRPLLAQRVIREPRNVRLHPRLPRPANHTSSQPASFHVRTPMRICSRRAASLATRVDSCAARLFLCS